MSLTRLAPNQPHSEIIYSFGMYMPGLYPAWMNETQTVPAKSPRTVGGKTSCVRRARGRSKAKGLGQSRPEASRLPAGQAGVLKATEELDKDRGQGTVDKEKGKGTEARQQWVFGDL